MRRSVRQLLVLERAAAGVRRATAEGRLPEATAARLLAHLAACKADLLATGKPERCRQEPPP